MNSDQHDEGVAWDTALSVPAPSWAATFILFLKLEGEPLDLRALEQALLNEKVYNALGVAIKLARPND